MASEIKIDITPSLSSFRMTDGLIKGLTQTVNTLNDAVSRVKANLASLNTGKGGAVASSILSNLGSTQGARQTAAISSLMTGQGVPQAANVLNQLNQTRLFGSPNTSSGVPQINPVINVGGGRGNGTPVVVPPAPPNVPPAPPNAPPEPGRGRDSFLSSAQYLGILAQQAPGMFSGGVAGMISGTARAAFGAAGYLGSGVGATVLSGVGLGASALYAGYQGANMISDAGHKAYFSNLEYQTNQPFRNFQMSGAANAPFQHLGSAIIRGDFRSRTDMEDAIALSKSTDKNKRSVSNAWRYKESLKDLSTETLGLDTVKGAFEDPLRAKTRLDTAITEQYLANRKPENRTPGSVSSMAAAMESSMDGISPSLGALASFGGKRRPIDLAMTDFEIEKAKREATVGALQGSNLIAAAEAISANRSSAEIYWQDQNNLGSAMGRIASMRQAGMSTGSMKLRDGREVEKYEYYKSIDEAGGWDPGDRGANYQRILGTGRGYRKLFGAHGLSSAGIEGFTNIDQIAKLGAILGGSVGAGGAFVSQMNGRGGVTGGAGGLDVAVARELGQGVAQAMLSSGVGGGLFGGSSLQAATSQAATAAFFGSGGDVGRQQFNAMADQRGMALMGTYTSGSRSGFNSVAAWSSAIKNTGGYGLGTDALMAADPATMAAIGFGKGDSRTALEKEMFSKDAARNQYIDVSKQAFYEIRKHNITGEVGKGVYANWEAAGGDPALAIARKAHGVVGSKEYTSSILSAASDLAVLKGGDKVANEGMFLRDFFLQHPEAVGGPRGNGAHAASPRGQEKNRVEEQGIVDAMLASSKYDGTVSKELLERIDTRADKSKIMGMYNKQVKGDIGSLSDNFVKACTDLANFLKTKRGGTQNERAGAAK